MQACSRAPGRCGCCTLPKARRVPGQRARSRRRNSAWSTSQPMAALAVRLLTYKDVHVQCLPLCNAHQSLIVTQPHQVLSKRALLYAFSEGM